VNGRYGHAETPQDRIAIAVIAATNQYVAENPQGIAPGQVFLAEFLQPFIERELSTARLDELHSRVSAIAPRERELVEKLHGLTKVCAERIGPSLEHG
jgi:hypothetical protein